MAQIDTLFATSIYRASLGAPMARDISRASLLLAKSDKAGQTWCRANDYRGYTSYASLNDLPWRFPEFAALVKRIGRHVGAFADALDFDLQGHSLELDSLWVNLLKGGGHHSAHLHPHSILSGTLYVEVPAGSGAIRFEDLRLPMMMAAPVRAENAPEPLRPFVDVAPAPGLLLLWESWLRHEVRPNTGRGEPSK